MHVSANDMCVWSSVGALKLLFFFFNDTATTEIYTLSLHDALPICVDADHAEHRAEDLFARDGHLGDRKSTRLNSSHLGISYAVFCLKKKINHRKDGATAMIYKPSRVAGLRA